jgi:hypothetical protein
MRVAVVICTYNRADLLRTTLTRIQELAVPPGLTWEIVVINNRCTDHTDEVVAAFAGRLPVRGLHEQQQADYLLFTDDDVLVRDSWLTGLLEAIQTHPDAAVIGGPVEPWFRERPDPSYLRAFPVLASGFCGVNPDIPLGELPSQYQVVGANMAVRTASVGTVRYDTTLGPGGKAGLVGGGETRFVAQLRAKGGKVIWSPGMRVAHCVTPERMRLRYLLGFEYGAGRVAVWTRGVPPGPRLLGVPRWLVRRAADEVAKSISSLVRGERAESLGAFARACRFAGMARECVRLYRQFGDRAPVGAPGLTWE